MTINGSMQTGTINAIKCLKPPPISSIITAYHQGSRPETFSMRNAIVLAAGLLFAGSALSADPPKITWKRTVIDKKFNSEGVTIGDVNKDGKMDVITGEI